MSNQTSPTTSPPFDSQAIEAAQAAAASLEEVFSAARAWITHRTLSKGTMTGEENNAAHERFNIVKEGILAEPVFCDHCQQGTPAFLIHETPEFNDGHTCSYCLQSLASIHEDNNPTRDPFAALEDDLTDDPENQCVCADCGNLAPVCVEHKATRPEGHCGHWSDCSECGITGVQFCPCDTEELDYQIKLKHFGESYQPTQEEMLEVLRDEEQERFDRLSLEFFNSQKLDSETPAATPSGIISSNPDCTCNQCLAGVPQFCFNQGGV